MSTSHSINIEEIAKINNLEINNNKNNNINDMNKPPIPSRHNSKNFSQQYNQIYIKKNNAIKSFPNTKFKNNKLRLNKYSNFENININEINNITSRVNPNNYYTTDNIFNFSNAFKEQFSKTSKLLNDFKNTLKQTETIRSRIIDTSYDIEHKLHYPSINYYYNNAKQTLNDINEKYKDVISNNSYDNISVSDEDGLGEGGSFKAEGDESFDFNLKNNNGFNKYNNKYSKNLYYFKDNNINSNEKEKIKILNQKLSNSNSHLAIENKSIESELFRYKIKERDIQRENQIQNQYQKLPFSSFDISLNKFINSLKLSLQRNINDNLAIAQKIFNEQNEFQLCYKNNINQVSIYEKLIKKINDENERVVNIQKYNKENSRRYKNLLEEKDILNNRLEKMKISIYDLKSKGKILSIKKESNLKSKKDTEELILKLYKAIQNMKREISSESNGKTKNVVINNINSYSFSLMDEKINQLYNVISGIVKEKNMINSENAKIMDNINNIEKRNISSRKEGVKLNELNIDLNNLKLQKMNMTKDIEEKEDEIKLLKDTIDKLSNGVKIDINDIKNICDDIIGNDESEKIKKENQLESNKLDEEIKEAINLNSFKNNEIKSASKEYDLIIKEKEQEILSLEKELKQKEQKEPSQDSEEKINQINQPMYYNQNLNMKENGNENDFNNDNFEHFKNDKNHINKLILNNEVNNDVIEGNKIHSDGIYNHYEDNKNNESNVSYEYFVDNENEEEEQPNEYYEENMNEEEGNEEYYYNNPEEEEYENNNENGDDNEDLEYKEIDPNNIELPEEYKEFNKNFEEEENEEQSDNVKENGKEKDKENI